MVNWAKSEQMLADVLTKMLPGRYARQTLEGGTWTLGRDDRAPSIRGRRLADSDLVEADELKSELNARMVKCLRERKTLGNVIAEDKNDISTILAETDAMKNETTAETFLVITLDSEMSPQTSQARSTTPPAFSGQQIIVVVMIVMIARVLNGSSISALISQPMMYLLVFLCVIVTIFIDLFRCALGCIRTPKRTSSCPTLPTWVRTFSGQDRTFRSNKVTMTIGNAVAIVVHLGPSVMNTGEHSGKSFEWNVNNDPSYVAWLLCHVLQAAGDAVHAREVHLTMR